MEKVSKTFNNVIKIFFFFVLFWHHSASLLTPLMVQFLFHQIPEFSNFLAIAMLGSYQIKKIYPNVDGNFQENKALNEWDAYAFLRMGQQSQMTNGDS